MDIAQANEQFGIDGRLKIGAGIPVLSEISSQDSGANR